MALMVRRHARQVVMPQMEPRVDLARRLHPPGHDARRWPPAARRRRAGARPVGTCREATILAPDMGSLIKKRRKRMRKKKHKKMLKRTRWQRRSK